MLFGFGDEEGTQDRRAVNAWLREPDAHGTCPLDRAMGTQHQALMDLLLRQEAEDAEYSKSGSLPLHRTALAGLTDSVRMLIAAHHDAAQLDEYGETALHKAVRQGHREVVELVLDKCDANQTNCYGMTPLHYTALNARLDIAELLMNHNADPSIANEHMDELTPIGLAEIMGYGSLKGLMEGEEAFF